MAFQFIHQKVKIMKTTTATKLPESVTEYLIRNWMFNVFGIVNLSALRSVAKCDMDAATLKILINKRFADEMTDGKIEFIEKRQF